jgi:hypothetical protein
MIDSGVDLDRHHARVGLVAITHNERRDQVWPSKLAMTLRTVSHSPLPSGQNMRVRAHTRCKK